MGMLKMLLSVVFLVDVKTFLALGDLLDAADDHVGGVRMTEGRG